MGLTAAHWFYLFGICFIIFTMLRRKNIVVPSIIMSFLVGWVYTGSFSSGVQTIFQASLTAAGELFNIFLIIAVMTALLHSLKEIGADEQMIIPFQRVMKTGHLSFWVIVFVTYLLSLFFWPTPAVPLIAALLLPVAIRSALPPIGAAVAIALAGPGMALSSYYIIQIAPMLTATSAGVPVSQVADRAFILSLVAGVVAITLAYMSLKKTIQKPSENVITQSKGTLSLKIKSERNRLLFAILVPVTFFIIILYMILSKLTASIASLEGGAGAALIGGAALLLLILATFSNASRQALAKCSDFLVEGFVFAFKAMGPVIPIAGFFFLGSAELSSRILSLNDREAPSFLFDLVQAGQQFIPENAFLAGFAILLIGAMTGLDGSGFSGLPLVGALSGALSPVVGVDAATLGAIGQLGAIWVGGGTLIAWSSLVAVAGFTNVPVLELVRRCLVPVVTGLVVATVIGLLLF